MSSLSQTALIDALVLAAEAWRDPDYAARAEAVAQTLEAPNRFTEEALAFAINQQMHLITGPALQEWVAGRKASTRRTVGVLNAGNVPLAGLQDLLAVLLVGHRYLGTVSSKSPYLLPAIVEEVRRHVPVLPVSFVEVEALFVEAEVVIATGTDETRDWASEQCEAHGVPRARRLLRGSRYAVAIIDGQESDDEREGLAEDALLHEGLGCRNVALIWAPRGLSPDPYLDAMAQFRGVFPVHAETPGTLKMQQAFLEAVGTPHAHGEGLEFLVSRGAPAVQQPGHVRWTEYDDLEGVNRWLQAHADTLQLVVARPQVVAQLQAPIDQVQPGEAQRPPLAWCADGRDVIDFLASV